MRVFVANPPQSGFRTSKSCTFEKYLKKIALFPAVLTQVVQLTLSGMNGYHRATSSLKPGQFKKIESPNQKKTNDPAKPSHCLGQVMI